MSLGDFNDSFGGVATNLVWVLFLLCSVFNLIVMMNLLIAIVSETFARVIGQAEQTGFQQMASLVAENNYLVSDEQKLELAPDNSYLIVAGVAAAIEVEIANPVEAKVTYIRERIRRMEKVAKEQGTKLENVLTQVTEIGDILRK